MREGWSSTESEFEENPGLAKELEGVSGPMIEELKKLQSGSLEILENTIFNGPLTPRMLEDIPEDRVDEAMEIFMKIVEDKKSKDSRLRFGDYKKMANDINKLA